MFSTKRNGFAFQKLPGLGYPQPFVLRARFHLLAKLLSEDQNPTVVIVVFALFVA